MGGTAAFLYIFIIFDKNLYFLLLLLYYTRYAYKELHLKLRHIFYVRQTKRCWCLGVIIIMDHYYSSKVCVQEYDYLFVRAISIILYYQFFHVENDDEFIYYSFQTLFKKYCKTTVVFL